jgi:hypothetical protein
MPRPGRWLVGPLLALFALLGACTLPGRSGWECDDDRDCKRGLECRSVHGDRGYSSVCLAPGETTAVSGGNWMGLLTWSAVGVALVVAVIGRIVVARNRRREADPSWRPKRRRR